LTKRSIALIILGLFIGAMIGSLIGVLLAFMLPEGVVKNFFLIGIDFDLGGLLGDESGVIVIDLLIVTVKFGLSIYFNFTSLIGLATAYYFLRYFR
jgi:hypothetical protein